MQLHQNYLWKISYDEAVSSVKIDWTEKTAHMTDADFKDALSRFASHAEQHSARCLLVDVQRFKPALSEEIGQRRDSAIIPRYNAVGIQKMGYIIGPNAQLSPAQDAGANPDQPRTFRTRFFHSEDEAVTWFHDSEWVELRTKQPTNQPDQFGASTSIARSSGFMPPPELSGMRHTCDAPAS